MTSTHASPTPTLATSQEIRDRGSTFVGYIYHARTADEARVALRHHTRPRHAGEHKDGKDVRELYVIAAWRCMVVKPGRTGLGGPDEFTVEEGCEDGGERWAGGRALGVMKREGVIDAVVVICRWCVVVGVPRSLIGYRYSYHACQVRRDVVGSCPVHSHRDLCQRGVSQVQEDGGDGGVCSNAENAGRSPGGLARRVGHSARKREHARLKWYHELTDNGQNPRLSFHARRFGSNEGQETHTCEGVCNRGHKDPD